MCSFLCFVCFCLLFSPGLGGISALFLEPSFVWFPGKVKAGFYQGSSGAMLVKGVPVWDESASNVLFATQKDLHKHEESLDNLTSRHICQATWEWRGARQIQWAHSPLLFHQLRTRIPREQLKCQQQGASTKRKLEGNAWRPNAGESQSSDLPSTVEFKRRMQTP